MASHDSTACEKFLDAISALVDAVASPELQGFCDAHRAACSACAGELALALEIEQGLVGLDLAADVEPPAGMWDRFARRLDGECAWPGVRRSVAGDELCVTAGIATALVH